LSDLVNFSRDAAENVARTSSQYPKVTSLRSAVKAAQKILINPVLLEITAFLEMKLMIIQTKRNLIRVPSSGNLNCHDVRKYFGKEYL
jgi:hypothetical protein